MKRHNVCLTVVMGIACVLAVTQYAIRAGTQPDAGAKEKEQAQQTQAEAAIESGRELSPLYVLEEEFRGIVCPLYSLGNGMWYTRVCDGTPCTNCSEQAHPFPEGTTPGDCDSGEGCSGSRKMRENLVAMKGFDEVPSHTYEPDWSAGSEVVHRQIVDFRTPDGSRKLRGKFYSVFHDPRTQGKPLQPVYFHTGHQIRKRPGEQPHFVVNRPARYIGPHVCLVSVGGAHVYVITSAELTPPEPAGTSAEKEASADKKE
jgi:hypothetical protein